MLNNEIKFKSFHQIKDKYLGKEGTTKRDQYKIDLKLDILGNMIKHLRNEKNLTQTQLGEMIDVKRSEISKLDQGLRNMTMANVLKIFQTLQASMKFVLETKEHQLHLQ